MTEMEGIPGLKQGADACDVAYHGHGKSMRDAFAIGFAVALASQPEHSEEAGESRDGLELEVAVAAAASGQKVPRHEWARLSDELKRGRSVALDFDALHFALATEVLDGDREKASQIVAALRKLLSDRPAPSPEPGSDAEVAERLRKLADSGRLGDADGWTIDLLHRAADRLLARPVLSREQLRDRIYHSLDMHAELDEAAAERAAFAVDFALDESDVLAAQSDQENPDA